MNQTNRELQKVESVAAHRGGVGDQQTSSYCGHRVSAGVGLPRASDYRGRWTIAGGGLSRAVDYRGRWTITGVRLPRASDVQASDYATTITTG